jgi:hypothetical protein
MIHVVVMKRLIGLPLLIHTELLWRRRSRSFKNRGLGVGASVYRLHSPDFNTYVAVNVEQPVVTHIHCV